MMQSKQIPLNERIIFALDLADPKEAIQRVEQLDDQIKFFKVGLQLFFAGGWQVIDRIADRGNKVMLDLKLYDIPATVELAVRQFAHRGVTLTTVHGYTPVVEAALAAGSGVEILAVTVLTSFGDSQLAELDYRGSLEELVLKRAKSVVELGCHGVVCSAQEAAMLRTELGNGFTMVTPGIRPAGTGKQDQQRVATPGAAIGNGADYLVIGRPIRDSEDPKQTIASLQEEIANTLE